MRTKSVEIFKNQSGVALVIALIMIIVLTVIVLAASLTSIFDIKLAGNKRGSTDAFFGADSGVQIVMVDVDNFDLPGKYSAGKYHYSEDVANKNPTRNPTDADIMIYHTSTQTGPPRGLGFSAAGNYEFIHFLIESTGKDQVDKWSPQKSTCVIQQKAVRLVPTLQGGN